MDSKEKSDFVVARDGRIVETGHGELKIEEDTSMFDLEGMTMIPGFIDSHNHMLTAGLSKFQLDLGNVEYGTIEDLMNLVIEYSNENPMLDWIRCVGLDESKLEEERIPDRFELDKYIKDKPVIITRVCSHVSVLNSRGIMLANLSSEDLECFGSQISKTNDKLNGIITDEAQAYILDKLPEYTDDEIIRAIDISQQELFKMGICSVHEPGTDQVSSSAYINGYICAQDRKVLKMRTFLMGRKEKDSVTDIVDKIIELKKEYSIEDSRLHFGAMKFFADGSIGGKTAAVYDGYCGSESKGILMTDEIRKHIEYCSKKGFQISVHAIGDNAIDNTVDIFESLDYTSGECRNRIEHCELCGDKTMDKVKKNCIMVSIQPAFIYEFGDKYCENLGRDRTNKIMPCRSFLDNDILFSFSADYPFSDGRPLMGIKHAAKRETKDGFTMNENERIDVFESVKAYTINAAKMSATEKYQGTIAEGKFADFTILNKDIFKNGIDNARIEYTIVNDEIVYGRETQ